MKVKIFEFNPVSENTFVVYDETKECIIVDAGCYFPEEREILKNFISHNQLVVKHLVNTHLHFDHVFGCNFVAKEYNVVLEANKEDQFLLDGFAAQLKMFGFPDISETPHIGKFLDEGDIIEFGNQKFTILHVPGHSPGSLVFYNAIQNCMLAGDVLFNGSIGRTDLARGNYQQLITGIKEKLLILPDDTLVYPGHGPSTTIGNEKRNNPFLR